MIPQLEKITRPHSIPVYSCGGFNSLTAIRQIVDACVHESVGPTVVLHLGDYDPSGESIFERIARDVAAFLGEDRDHDGQTFEAERVALTREQLEEEGLPTDPITTNDTRSKAWKRQSRHRKCELEALPPNRIAELLRAAVERRVDSAALGRVMSAERRDRAVLVHELLESNRCRIDRQRSNRPLRSRHTT